MQSLEVELAANFGIGTTGMWNIVRIEWHHVSKEFRVTGSIFSVIENSVH